MGCTPSKSTSMSMAERRVATGIGHTSRLPQRTTLPDKLMSDENQTASKVWGRRSIKSTAVPVQPEECKSSPKVDQAGHLLKEEIEKRIRGSSSSKTVSIGDKKVTYAVLTQTGFYPTNTLKPNQDDYSISHNIGGEMGVSCFAVYDGHGDDGHKCADFIKSTLPAKIGLYSRKFRVKAAKSEAEEKGEKFVFNPKKWPALTTEQCESICVSAFEATNKVLHGNTEVPDHLSGSTAVSAILYGNSLTISNTGDSRAVLGTFGKGDPGDDPAQDEPKKLYAVPLSHDQTPYRKDELDRVRKAGARVLTIDQLQNDEPEQESWEEKEVNYDGDIPRIWKQKQEYPGTAFTRSLGDSVAEELGVIGTPEVSTRELTPEDKILVIGTDGIFEFLSNQQVLDICMKSKDPLSACKDLIAASYEEWLEYESRVDDITVIVVFL